MKAPNLSVEKIAQLPLCMQTVIPEAYRDRNNHMNMRYYVAVFDDAGDTLHDMSGLTREFHQQHQTGTMDLEHHTWFINEVLTGSQVSVYTRVVARSAKLIHFLLFMINDSNGKLAAIFECVNALTDLRVRRTTPFPPDVAAKIDALVEAHAKLDWPAPVCGAMRV